MIYKFHIFINSFVFIFTQWYAFCSQLTMKLHEATSLTSQNEVEKQMQYGNVAVHVNQAVFETL
jgi:hypothetical protein